MTTSTVKTTLIPTCHTHTIVAALRNWQHILQTGKQPMGEQAAMIHEIAGEGLACASPEDIDDIVAAIQTGDWTGLDGTPATTLDPAAIDGNHKTIQAYDAAMNNENQLDGPQPPNGDDYNALFDIAYVQIATLRTALQTLDAFLLSPPSEPASKVILEMRNVITIALKTAGGA